ncbi:MAG: hypothetical protein QM673_07020 [Gordonia sp. (in: high G+C Gram-positive bacteria)]
MVDKVRMGIKVPVKFEIAHRIKVLTEAARTIGQAVGASSSDLDIISYGVTNRCVSRVTFLLEGNSGIKPGLVEMNFDWDRHVATLASDSESNSFIFDPRIEMTQQVSPILKRTAHEIEKRMKSEKLTKCSMSITYDSDEYKERMKGKFDLSPVAESKAEVLKALRKNSIVVGDKKLDEFTVRLSIGNGSY